MITDIELQREHDERQARLHEQSIKILNVSVENAMEESIRILRRDNLPTLFEYLKLRYQAWNNRSGKIKYKWVFK